MNETHKTQTNESQHEPLMTNAKEELLKHIKKIEERYKTKPSYIKICFRKSYQEDRRPIEGTLQDILPRIDVDYDSGYGLQYLNGCIWFEDGTWSTRMDYDGSEWWHYHRAPSRNDFFSFF